VTGGVFLGGDAWVRAKPGQAMNSVSRRGNRQGVAARTVGGPHAVLRHIWNNAPRLDPSDRSNARS
jgi:hypothetical protein